MTSQAHTSASNFRKKLYKMKTLNGAVQLGWKAMKNCASSEGHLHKERLNQNSMLTIATQAKEVCSCEWGPIKVFVAGIIIMQIQRRTQ